MNDIYLERLNMAFQLSIFCIELKVKYYQQKLFPDKSENEVREIVYRELLDIKNKELENAAQQQAKKHTDGRERCQNRKP